MCDTVRLEVRARFAIDMPIRTVGECLRRWGFTPVLERTTKRPRTRITMISALSDQGLNRV